MKPLSHVYVANAVINDVRANAGRVKIGSLGLFTVKPEFRAALLEETYAPFVRAGAVGPDAFPSLLTGQTQAHAYTDKWLAFVTSRLHTSGTSPAAVSMNAFYAGYLSHICADIWTHDWVNQYAGGPWPEMSKLRTSAGAQNVIKHLTIEGLMDKNVESVKGSMKVDTKVPVAAMVDLIVESKRIPVLADNERLDRHDISCSTFLEDGFARKYWFTEQYLGAKGPVPLYLKAWHADLKNGLTRWVTAHERAVARHLSRGEDLFSALQSEWSDWAKLNLLSMYGAPDMLVKLPVLILRAIDFDIPYLDEIKKKIRDNIKDYICQQAFGMTYSELMSKVTPTILRNLLPDQATYDKVVRECGNVPPVSQISETSNPIVWNSITFAKLALLPLSEQRRVSQACGITLDAQHPPIPFGVMCIDGTGQYQFGAMAPLTRALLAKGVLRHYEPDRVLARMAEPRDGRRRSDISGLVKSVSVKVRTADKLGAGTDADIYFGVQLRDGSKKEWLLDIPLYNDLEKGDDDWYHFFTGMPNARKDQVQSVYLRMANTKGLGPDWNCHSIRVSVNGGPERSFAVNKEFKKTGDTWSGTAAF